MDVSIILPTFNNAKMLASTLTAFEKVHFPKETEIIVVDNNSSDNTADVVESFSTKLPLRYAFEPKQGTSRAKNHGIRIAEGALLIFTDDDVRPNPDWIKFHLSAYKRNPEGYFYGGPVVSDFEGEVPEASLLRLSPPSVRGLDLGKEERILNPDEWFIGANWSCTSDALLSVGHFEEELGLNPDAKVALGSEETDLQRRLRSAGCSAMYLPTASLRHVVRTSKCTIKHIAARAEAGGRYSRSIAQEDKGYKTLNGVPLWRYRKLVERWISAWVKRISGQDWYADYVSYRADLGFLKGMPDKKINSN